MRASDIKEGEVYLWHWGSTRNIYNPRQFEVIKAGVVEHRWVTVQIVTGPKAKAHGTLKQLKKDKLNQDVFEWRIITKQGLLADQPQRYIQGFRPTSFGKRTHTLGRFLTHRSGDPVETLQVSTTSSTRVKMLWPEYEKLLADRKRQSEELSRDRAEYEARVKQQTERIQKIFPTLYFYWSGRHTPWGAGTKRIELAFNDADDVTQFMDEVEAGMQLLRKEDV